jgi:hypothetical protein
MEAMKKTLAAASAASIAIAMAMVILVRNGIVPFGLSLEVVAMCIILFFLFGIVTWFISSILNTNTGKK